MIDATPSPGACPMHAAFTAAGILCGPYSLSAPGAPASPEGQVSCANDTGKHPLHGEDAVCETSLRCNVKTGSYWSCAAQGAAARTAKLHVHIQRESLHGIASLGFSKLLCQAGSASVVWHGRNNQKAPCLKYFGRTCNFKDVTEMKSCRADRSVRWMSNSRGGTLWIAYLERGLVF